MNHFMDLKEQIIMEYRHIVNASTLAAIPHFSADENNF